MEKETSWEKLLRERREKMEEDPVKFFLGCFGNFLLGAVALPIQAILNGFIVMKFWEWFLVPIVDLRLLSIIEGIGIWLVICYIIGDPLKIKQKSPYYIKIATLLSSDAIILLIGWLFHKICF